MIVPPLCGGILFFQGWRLDPILQFGQFLLVAHVINTQIGLILSEEIQYRRGIRLSGEIKPLTSIKSETTRKDQYKHIESQLETLQVWTNKKLITEEEFKAKKKKLLDL
tara:strand:+ start:148 stop:474 length:327 start_codon:yes stop_codon:yes gene_type:complete